MSIRADSTPEYGRAVGIATPQANTTVEPEMQILRGGTVLAARLQSDLGDSRARLIDYYKLTTERVLGVYAGLDTRGGRAHLPRGVGCVALAAAGGLIRMDTVD